MNTGVSATKATHWPQPVEAKSTIPMEEDYAKIDCAAQYAKDIAQSILTRDGQLNKLGQKYSNAKEGVSLLSLEVEKLEKKIKETTRDQTIKCAKLQKD